MQDSSDNKYIIDDEFDNLNFGISNEIAGYGKNKNVKSVADKSTSMAAFICGVIKDCIADIHISENPPSFVVGFDDAARSIYLRREIRFQDLDKSSDITGENVGEVKFYAHPGDKLQSYVPKNLGGTGDVGNWFPLNSEANTEKWEIALKDVYKHVHQGEEYSARIMYAMIHSYRDEYSIGNRPSHIYYIFNLYKNGQFIGERIQGRIHNPVVFPIVNI
uniref:Uncharacterized protein n=1 Tax=Panagrolaimus davidi TaxID=227884 RepID=A0A914PIM3_9BILA